MQCIPVRCAGSVIAVVTRETPTTLGRRPGELERYYLDVFDRFARDDRRGQLPVPPGRGRVRGRAPRRRRRDRARRRPADALREPERGELAAPHGDPRVHVGSAARARSGFDQDAVDVAHPRPAAGHRGDRAGRHVDAGPGASRCSSGDESSACCVLLRDVTDLRRRDRMLLSKDATIREIHHRVKNNLQTIAALLRLQGRRLAVARGAGGDRGVGAADPLDRDRARDAVARRRRRRALRRHRAAARAGGRGDRLDARRRDLRFEVEGDAGELPGEVATPLAVVLNELMQNAVDHAFPRRRRRPDRGQRRACSWPATTASSSSTWSTTASGSRRASPSSSRGASGCRSSRRW